MHEIIELIEKLTHHKNAVGFDVNISEDTHHVANSGAIELLSRYVVSARSLRLMYRHGVTLLGVSRQGKRFTQRVRDLEIRGGRYSAPARLTVNGWKTSRTGWVACRWRSAACK